ncbi:hypothetical protein LSTR_LSTR007673 [Laodelphax striatellus]|uniref:Uncharacterized protein n=1 Tax=Laodelphax striatellus TaxID=195883 RepID=A0A482WIP0_LAOST|nr:hypothetical protein LSTR_LSTR007673 [Laodelphax striatellus]
MVATTMVEPTITTIRPITQGDVGDDSTTPPPPTMGHDDDDDDEPLSLPSKEKVNASGRWKNYKMAASGVGGGGGGGGYGSRPSPYSRPPHK